MKDILHVTWCSKLYRLLTLILRNSEFLFVKDDLTNHAPLPFKRKGGQVKNCQEDLLLCKSCDEVRFPKDTAELRGSKKSRKSLMILSKPTQQTPVVQAASN